MRWADGGGVGPEKTVVVNIFPETGSTVKDVMESAWTQEKSLGRMTLLTDLMLLWAASLAPSLSLSLQADCTLSEPEFANADKIKS